MKINCVCESIIVDNSDCLRNKGHLISDVVWFDFWNAIDEAVEKTGENEKEKENAVMN